MFDLASLFIAPAMAADVVAPATAAEAQSTLMRFAPLFLIFMVFYFLLIRPQQKQAQAHDKVLKELKKGDKIITKAGFVGTITKTEGELYVFVEIAKGVEVKVVRDTIAGPADEEHPANENKNKKA
ncbi:MAG: preprotein translocase subunit YajC [Alphaproteobacteria bacterium]|nr:preprotein translocase subunit YajC [Alphaproteobacteria bacterium]